MIKTNHMTRAVVFGILLSFTLACVATGTKPSLATMPGSGISHYMYVSRDRELIKDKLFLQSPGFSGAQLMYSWKELEPEFGSYDFSFIEADAAILAKYGKKLFVQLQDATFLPSNKPVPNYLLSRPEYSGGVAAKCNRAGEIEGWVARRWDSKVQERFLYLLKALGKRLDGVIAGINLQETAIDLEECGDLPGGFSFGGYLNGIKANIKALDESFRFSTTMQYANFMPGEWLPWEDQRFLDSVYQSAQQSGVAVGGG